METDTVVANLQRYFNVHSEGIACVYLHGSVARGTPRSDSDIDLAILLEEERPPTLPDSGAALAGEIEAKLSLPIDVVLLNSAPVDLVHRVLRDGIIVFEHNPLARIRFEVQARNAYFDLKPYLDEYRRAAGTAHGR